MAKHRTKRTKGTTKRRTKHRRSKHQTPRAGVGAPRRSRRIYNQRFKNKDMSMTGLANALEGIVEHPIKSAVGVTTGVGKAEKETARRIKKSAVKLTKKSETELANLFGSMGL